MQRLAPARPTTPTGSSAACSWTDEVLDQRLLGELLGRIEALRRRAARASCLLEGRFVRAAIGRCVLLVGSARRPVSAAASTGRTVAPNVRLVTAANEAYHAAAAVASPSQPPQSCTMFVCAAGVADAEQRRTSAVSSANTVAIAAVVRSDATNMYAVKMPQAIR